MTFILWLFCFLASNLWGNYIGARSGKGYASTKVHRPRGSAIFMNIIFTLIALSLLFTTSVSDVGAIGALVAAIVGFVIGLTVGRKMYHIN